MKIKEKNKKFYVFINLLMQIILSVIMVWSVFKLIVCSVYYNFISIIYCILFAISALGVAVNIIFSSVKNKKIETIFLMLAIPLGMCFLFLQLPSHKPDEPHHLYKSYAIATGDFIHAKDEKGVSQITVPKDMIEQDGLAVNNYQKMDEVLFMECNYDDTTTVASTAANYNPIAYVFSSLGIIIGKNLNLSMFCTIFLSRLMNYLFYLIIGYITIKKIPIGKKSMLLLLLCPMMLQQSTAITADVIMNSLSLFFIAYLLYLRFEKGQINYKDLIILLISILIITTIKIVYLPLIIVMVALLWDKLQNNKKMLISIGCTILVCIVVYLLTSMIYSYRNEDVYINPLVNGKEQIKFVIMNPVKYLNVLKNTCLMWGSMYATSMVGNYLAWYDLEYNGFMMIFYLIFLAMSAFENSKYELKKWEKIITIFTFLIIFNIMFLGIYIQWNSVGANIIAGIQGRYFIPFILLLIIPLFNRKNNIEVLNRRNWIYSIYILVSNICILCNMIPKYY